MSLYIEWIVKKKEENHIVIDNDWFLQKVYFDLKKMKNSNSKENLENLSIDKSAILWVVAFAIRKKDKWAFIKYFLTWDVIN